MLLRPYQQGAVDAVWSHIRTRKDNPLVVIPTGGGKTPVIASMCQKVVGQWNRRVLVLAHVKELLEQSAEKIQGMCRGLPIGIYSAGLKRRDLGYAITIAGIQSVYERGCELGALDLIIVDECFVAGTMIATPAGDVPIELLSPGMTVRNANGIGLVQAVSVKPAIDLVTLEYSDGTTITCTPNHPIFTEQGWKRAGSLEVGSLAFGIESLRVLRGNVPALVEADDGRDDQGPKGTALAEATVLLAEVCKIAGKSDAIGGHQREDAGDDDRSGPLSENDRREREGNAGGAGSNVGDSGPNLGRRVSCPGEGVAFAVASEGLEDRSSQPGDDDCDRARRAQPSDARSKLAGRTEDDVPGSKRLVGVSRHKRTSPGAVFNLQVSGHPSYFANGLLVHNCHMVPAEDDGMYRTLFAATKAVNPKVRVCGLTATPYRMSSGPIAAPGNILNHICYEVGVRELIDQGYLSQLRAKSGRGGVETKGLHVRGGEFVQAEVEELMADEIRARTALQEIVDESRDRKGVLIFASSVPHARMILRILEEEHGVKAGLVTGASSPADRERVIGAFKAKDIKFLVNVNVLTTGFDAPHVDVVALMRPTMSPGLYYQMVGRGFRLSPGKTDCLVLDYGENVINHGPVDLLTVDAATNRGGSDEKPGKACPKCQALIAAGYASCPECGFEFPERVRRAHTIQARGGDIVSDGSGAVWHSVVFWSYRRNVGKPGKLDTLRVDYTCEGDKSVSEWICIDHEGYAREKACDWWKLHAIESMPVPTSIFDALVLMDQKKLRTPSRIKVKRNEKTGFREIVDREFDPIEEDAVAVSMADGVVAQPPSAAMNVESEDIPF